MIILIALVIIILISACPVINRPPREPKLVSPTNGSEVQSTWVILQWSCEEPDYDSIKYDIYLGKNANPSTIIQRNFEPSDSTIRYIVLSLDKGATYYWKVVAYDDKGSSRNGPVWKFTTSAIPGVRVEKGSFTMGDTWGDGDIGEKPTHKVTFTYDFYIGKYEVTFAEYDAFCESTGKSKPSDYYGGWGREIRPVIYVSWWDAIAYCNWLSGKEKIPKAYDNNGNLLDKDGRVTIDPSKVVGYRLPTEAEWEYAARGGNKSEGYKYSGSDNVNEVAWVWQTGPEEVGNKAPNELGIYDMSGNVWEWCSDWYGNYSSSAQTNPYNSTAGSSRVYRGGGFRSHDWYARVASRSSNSPSFTRINLGFRIARTVP